MRYLARWTQAGQVLERHLKKKLASSGVDLISRLGLTDAEKDKVYYRNAKQLVKL